MKIEPKDFRLDEGNTVHLDTLPTAIDPVYKSKEQYHDMLNDHVGRLIEQQAMLAASQSHSVLIVLQAMDTAGKDGVIKHVMSGVNPQDCSVTSFKRPSEQELRHDFLWRSVCKLPERGRIGIFNRSYYEEVLVTRVHPELLQHEGISDPDVRKEFWQNRYTSINDFERHLALNRTLILKFYLHLSKREQKRRLIARIDDADKNWKFSEADIAERTHWKEYMKAYEKCLRATSTKKAPWYAIPADDKDTSRILISGIIVDALEKLGLAFPYVNAQHHAELLKIRKTLVETGRKSRQAK